MAAKRIAFCSCHKPLATLIFSNQQRLGGEAMTETPTEVQVQHSSAIRLRVPDIVWSAEPGFFDGPPEIKVLPHPPELCVEVKADSNTMKDVREKRDDLLAAGAKEVWFVFVPRRWLGLDDIQREAARRSQCRPLSVSRHFKQQRTLARGNAR
jgi:Uma2 family endonuclease